QRYLRGEELSVYPDPFRKKVWRYLAQHQKAASVGVFLLFSAVVALTAIEVIREAQRKQDAAEHAQKIAEQVGLVTQRAQQFDARVRAVENELSHLAGAVEHVLILSPEQEAPLLRPKDLEKQSKNSPTTEHSRYAGPISFQRPVIIRAPEADPQANLDEQRLHLVEDDFKHAYSSTSIGTSNTAFDSTPLQWIYVATPSGVLLNYPATADFPKGYDPRKLPFYRQTIGTIGPVWGQLHPPRNGAGLLLPCHRAVYDTKKRLLAILGIDFRLGDVEKALTLDSVPHFQRAWLLDKENLIIATTNAPNDVSSKAQVTAPAQALKLRPFPHPELIEERRISPSSGEVLLKRSRLLYASIPALKWVYVIQTGL
ncbi:MAG: cache domain-containing protein, partial [Polyangiaceae bacterium]|nr:cache domain-containing protein [Polyangiaceae bacterium]